MARPIEEGRPAEQMSRGPFDTLRELHNRYQFLMPISSEILKYSPDLFWHQTNVATGYIKLVDKLKDKVGSNYEALLLGVPGAFLHDIGKLGIEKTINKSLETMAENSEEAKIKREQHTIVGSEMIKLLVTHKIIPKEIGEIAADVAKNHHRTDDNFKHSYPRTESLKGKDPTQVAREFLTELIDTAIAMLSIRSYRPLPLSIEEINKELANRLSGHQILDFISPIFNNMPIDDLRGLLRNEVLAILPEIEDYINIKPTNEQLINLIGKTDTRLNLQNLFSLQV